MGRLLRVGLGLLLSTIVGSGCTIRIGGGFSPLGDDGTSQDEDEGTPTRLPEPDIWRVSPPELTPEQQQKQDEVDQYLLEEYRDYEIVATTQGYSGDIIDWMNSDSLPGPQLEPPPPTWTAADLVPSPGAGLARTELELYPELRGPEGTTPFHRPDFAAYVLGQTGASSLEDYLDSYQEGGQPSGQKRLYAGFRWDVPNMGASGSINQYGGDVEQGTFSLIEIAVACSGLDEPNTLEQIGAVVSRDKVNFPGFFDTNPRMHIEYLAEGYESMRKRKGAWDHQRSGFIAQRGRPYGPGVVVPASTLGLGTPPQEHRFDIQQDASGNWWIAHNGNTLGYYPASLFDLLNLGACRSAWYGEVFDPTPTDWTWTDMGSGEFGPAAYGYAAYVKDPIYRDLLNAPTAPIDDPLVNLQMTPFANACYTRATMTKAAPPWGRYLYLGGPGGDAPGCD